MAHEFMLQMLLAKCGCGTLVRDKEGKMGSSRHQIMDLMH